MKSKTMELPTRYTVQVYPGTSEWTNKTSQTILVRTNVKFAVRAMVRQLGTELRKKTIDYKEVYELLDELATWRTMERLSIETYPLTEDEFKKIK